MDERFVKKLLIPSTILGILAVAFFYDFKYLLDLFIFKRKHILIIGILSAPGNFEQRLSIRKTWLQLLSEISGSSYFIIGNEVCDVPPLDRPDPYSCFDKPFTLPENATKNTMFSTMVVQEKRPSLSSISNYIGFSFYVRKPITVKGLGVLRDILQFCKAVRVQLVSSYKNEILASVTFYSEFHNQSQTKVLKKAINPVFLEDGYEATVKLVPIRKMSFYHSCGPASWENSPQVINYIQLWEEESSIPQPFSNKSCTYVAMFYTIQDVDTIRDDMKNKSLRLKEWRMSNKILAAKLLNESNFYSDLLFVKVVDVYRNLTMKMVKFYKKVSEAEYFHYILKTDDDSFVDLIRVYYELVKVNKELDSDIKKDFDADQKTGSVAKLRLSKFWWWSYFKEFWKVQRAGKWRDDFYRAVSYPTFPCGGAYVVNKGVVDYIAANEHHLNFFQGEDVSLGIWMSALPATQYKVSRALPRNFSFRLQKNIINKFQGKNKWTLLKPNLEIDNVVPNICEWTCDNVKRNVAPLCNKVQLSVDEIYREWNNYTKNGFL